MKKMLMTASVLAILVSPALAAVVFDRASGTGSADKQDLVNLFGNEVVATEEAAESVVFSLQRTRTWQTTCRRIGTTTTRVFTRNVIRTRIVLSSVVVNPANKPQSWTFDGYGSSTATGSFCPSGWVRVGTPTSINNGVLRLRAEFEGEVKTLKIVAGAPTP